MAMDLEILSAKLGVSKYDLFNIIKKIVLDDIEDDLQFYKEKATSGELIDYLNSQFSEEDLFDKLSEELECLQD